MLALDKNWVEEENSKSKIIEYRTMDFYGPFLTMTLKQYENGTMEVMPLYSQIETAQVSESHFSLLSKATQELYNEIGEFVLKTKLFDVRITSEKTEEALLKKLKDIRLF